jgi:hypothetical protein
MVTQSIPARETENLDLIKERAIVRAKKLTAYSFDESSGVLPWRM